MTHQSVSVVSQCSLNACLWMASGDQRRLTGSDSALKACSRRCAIQMAAFTLLLLYLQPIKLSLSRDSSHVINTDIASCVHDQGRLRSFNILLLLILKLNDLGRLFKVTQGHSELRQETRILCRPFLKRTVISRRSGCEERVARFRHILI